MDGQKYPEIKPWVRRLFDARGVRAPEKRLAWMGAQLERFLTWCRKQIHRGDVQGISVGYLESLREARSPDWQIEQASQALHAFSAGVENWHWDEDERGGWRPRFRIKASPETVETDGVPRSSMPTNQEGGDAESGLADWSAEGVCGVADVKSALPWVDDGRAGFIPAGVAEGSRRKVGSTRGEFQISGLV